MDRRMLDLSDYYADLGRGSEKAEVMNQGCNGNCSRNTSDKECDCVLAMAFVNMQVWDDVYSSRDAYNNGTLFPELNKPFLGGRRR